LAPFATGDEEYGVVESSAFLWLSSVRLSVRVVPWFGLPVAVPKSPFIVTTAAILLPVLPQ
jgi:hypothetical protein